MTTVQVLRAHDRPAVPWRNGGGVTREVARGRADEATDTTGDGFDWRISIADVAVAGPFSAYVGVARTIVLIEGGSMVLTVDNVSHDLGLYQPLTFDGGAATSCELPQGPTRDLNLMTTVGRASGTLEVDRLLDERPVALPGADPLVLIALAGTVLVSTPGGPSSSLGPLDALGWPSLEPVDVRGPGVLAVVRLTAG
jgi:uncharacterized protein